MKIFSKKTPSVIRRTVTVLGTDPLFTPFKASIPLSEAQKLPKGAQKQPVANIMAVILPPVGWFGGTVLGMSTAYTIYGWTDPLYMAGFAVFGGILGLIVGLVYNRTLVTAPEYYIFIDNGVIYPLSWRKMTFIDDLPEDAYTRKEGRPAIHLPIPMEVRGLSARYMFNSWKKEDLKADLKGGLSGWQKLEAASIGGIALTLVIGIVFAMALLSNPQGGSSGTERTPTTTTSTR